MKEMITENCQGIITRDYNWGAETVSVGVPVF